MSPISLTRLFVLSSTTFTAHPLLDLGTENRQDAFLETCSHGQNYQNARIWFPFIFRPFTSPALHVHSTNRDATTPILSDILGIE